ncbi:amidohydrolase [Pseudomonas sp. BIGb0427]|uniref:amidohydrolase n=1 Tax=unclassified Pseudomonas TaxID=196821 RepID=UPI0018A74CC4|nr:MULTISPECIES: amidohydrolase [unclassified Pseudomonas]QPG61683.1 amidohydrolase [Pseudomonas sp. BIGb0427]UVM69194.1 amidohydrolase [Pseudomonas sp. B21-009]
MQRLIPTLLATALACASLPALAAADLVLFNGKVYTGEPGQGLMQAVAVKDGKVLQVGSDTQIQALADAHTQRIDLAGKVLMPGMIDSHSHPVVAAYDSLGANLQDEVKPLPALEQWILAEVEQGRGKAGDVISVAGASSAYWDNSRELGQLFNQGRWATQPLVLSGIDGHTGWANQAMLKRMQIDAAWVKSLSEQDRSYVGHEADFSPNGYFAEARWDQVRSQIPAASQEVMLKAAREAVRVNNQYGVTAWMDAAANAGSGDSLFDFKATAQTVGVLPLYRALAERGELNAHVAALMITNPKSRPADLEVLAQVVKQFEGVPNLSFPGIKVFVDGVLEYPGQSAAVITPYSNSHKNGQLLIEPQHFGELVAAAEQRDWIVHMHAVGDRAVRESLNGVAYARTLQGKPLAHSISHLQMVDPKDFARFKQLGVIASMQMLWATAENYTVELVKPYVSAQGYAYQYPAHSLQQAGALIAGASDWPVSSPNPWNAIAQAMTRKGPLGVLNAKESVDRQVMFQAYTLNAAKALRLERQIGSLAPGKQADLIVLDRDVFKVSAQELFDTRVLKTYFAGKQVYASES